MGPEPFWHFGNSVDSQTVNVVFLNQISDPAQQSGSDVIVLLLQVSQVGQSAVFNSVLVVSSKIVVRNGTPIMVVFFLVERIIDAKVFIQIAHVITDDVDHDPNVSGVTGSYEVLEVLFRAKVVVQLVQISAPVSVVASISVVDNGGDPDGVKAHALNVIEVVDDALVTTSTVISEISAIILLAIIAGESVCKELINGPSLPLLRRAGDDATNEKAGQNEKIDVF